MGLEYYWRLLRKSWTFSLWGRHVTVGFWINIVTDQVIEEKSSPDESLQERYQYDQLEAPSHIRVFKLQPGNANDPIKGSLIEDPIIPYEALSYIWGPPENHSYIEIDGRAFPILPNLDAALRHLRHTDAPRFLWIDYLCINQENMEERQTQVSMMLDIYHRATVVDVWLGSSKDSSAFGIQVLSFLTGKEPMDQAPWVLMPEQPFAAGFHEVISRAWFERMWVVQEAAVSQKAVMMCGTSQFSWNSDAMEVRRFIRRIKYAAISPQWEQAGLSNTNPGKFLQILNLQMQYISRTSAFLNDFPQDILDVAFELRHRKATDRRDKLFAILGLASLGGEAMVLQPDYSMNVEEVFERLLSVIEV